MSPGWGRTIRSGAVRALVTGVGGFIGSHLVERLVSIGWEVLGVDRLTRDDPPQKRANLAELESLSGFSLVDGDLRCMDVAPLLDQVRVVLHQAGLPGVRGSWDDFGSYVDHNILVTQRLLEAARSHSIERFVYASSSSVYGDALAYPTREDVRPMPKSPYGVTKLAAEHLCGVYARNFDVPTVSLRYFTVYGPRQRPDMAMHRLVEAAVGTQPFPMYGDGSQVRDFTFVSDVVDANLAAATVPGVSPGTVVNVAGAGATTLAEVVEMVGRLTGRPVRLNRLPAQPGDVERTSGDISAAARVLDWAPTIDVTEGMERQVEWHLSRRAILAQSA
jgi:nucleoside-diphosphate-sugar epimerase